MVVAAVREFNRFYTAAIGVLGEGLLASPYALTEARVLFELAQRDRTEVVTLRTRLGLDPGYLSRILARFDRDGLTVRDRSEADGRRQVVTLTPAGRAAFGELDERSTAEITALLARVPAVDQDSLIAAMRTIRVLLAGPADPTVTLRGARPGELGWIVARHGALYAAERGWDSSFEAGAARIVADYADSADPTRDAVWIAEVGGVPAGSIMCVRADEETARLRLLLVEPWARGLGVGTRLIDGCVAFARVAGYRRLTLWTVAGLDAARRRYERVGFLLDRQGPFHGFGHDLVEQVWSLELS